MTNNEPVQSALNLIETDYAEELSIKTIAEHVAVSPFHFQRMFIRDVGESVAGYIRSRRLEQAVKLIAADRDASLIQVAFECGFETHSAFSKAFKRHFEMSPSQFAKGGAERVLTSSADTRPFLKPIRLRQFEIEMDFLALPPLWVQHRQQTGVLDGAYFPDRKKMAAELAGLIVKDDENLMAVCGGYRAGPNGFNDASATGSFGGLFFEKPNGSWSDQINRIEAGNWAVFSHYGSFERLHMTWNKACQNWLPANHLSIRQEWMLETYLRSPASPKPDLLSAQIYIPLKKARMEQRAE